MKITNIRVYDIDETITDSGFPKSSSPTYSLDRAKYLSQVPSGSGHDCFLKGIVVRFTLQADHSFWTQFQRYHFHDIVSSESKMHSITKMELKYHPLVINDNILRIEKMIQMYNDIDEDDIGWLDDFKQEFDLDVKCKQEVFEAIIMNCPIGLELAASITTNYLQLKTVYAQRKTHKMSSWKEFCKFIESLPLALELIIQKKIKREKYFIDQDNFIGSFYLIPVNKKDEWNKWVNTGIMDLKTLIPPEYAKKINLMDISNIEFYLE